MLQEDDDVFLFKIMLNDVEDNIKSEQFDSLTLRRKVSHNRALVWWIATDGLCEPESASLFMLLSPQEQDRANRFHFDKDRLSFTLAHSLCRGILSFCTGRPPNFFNFSVGDWGKPEVMAPPCFPQLRINISHTRGMVAAALIVDHDIGVDVESTHREVQAIKVAEKMFAPRENADLIAAPDYAKLKKFLSYWTLKEAYVKATGKGLSQPLQAFSFDLASKAITFDNSLVDNSECWRFEQMHLKPAHILAVGLKHPTPKLVQIDIEEAPLNFLLSLSS